MKITRKWRRAWQRNSHQTRLNASRKRSRATARTKATQPKGSLVRRIVPRGLRPLAAAAGVMLAVLISQPGVQAMPAGGEVTGGSGHVQTNGTTMTVTQTSDKMAINWQQFNIAQNETVRFNQPSASSVALNRVVTNEGSVIAGRLSANGRVIVTNPNGVVFSPTAQVDVGGIVASSLHISDADFMNGRYVFNKTGANMGEVINQGTITAADGGYVVLLGDKVVNEGVIVANKGSVALAAGGGVTLDFSGDGLVNLAVSQSAMDALAENKNLIQADGGKVIMTARAAGDLVSSVVNNSGVIRARGISEKGGRIVLDGGAGGIAQTSGTLDVSSQTGTGGTINVLGDKVGILDDAVLNSSGVSGGGTILAGGNYQGKGPQQNATVTYVAPTAVLNADAVTRGDGGKVVVWADNTTFYYGALSARGGLYGGNGGNAEVSGKQSLTFEGSSVLLAPAGLNGNLLLDPGNVYIVASTSPDPKNMKWLSTRVYNPQDSTSTNSYISSAKIESTLSGGDVTILTTDGGHDGGHLYVQAPITYTGSNLLKLQSLDGGYHLYIDADISVKNLAFYITPILAASGIYQRQGAITASNLTIDVIGGKGTVDLARTGNQLGNVDIYAYSNKLVDLTLRNQSASPTLTIQKGVSDTTTTLVTGDMTVTHTAGGISLQGITVQGNLSLNAAGAIAQSDAATAAGAWTVSCSTV